MIRAFVQRAFATVCDREYFPGLWARPNRLWVYHQDTIPVYVFDFDLTSAQKSRLLTHPISPELISVSSLPFPSPGTWEAKQQVFAYLLKRASCIYLLDADLVLVSNVKDVFEWAEEGKIVSSHDGPGKYYKPHYESYSPSLPGCQLPYLNSGALCFNTRRHWDLAGLWAFASQYCVYSPDRGHPLQLAGHGDQGVFNAIASMLHKSDNFHILPETEWCDSTVGCALGIQEMSGNGELVVSNVTTGNKQRIVHSSGPKWWTKAGEVHQGRLGDKLKVFEHFYNFSRKGL